LSWSNVPDGTKSFVLLMIDPEGRGGAGVNHWVAHGIPGIGHRLCRRRGKQTDRQICRRQKHPRGRVLFRTAHSTQSNGPSLYVRADRNRSGADGVSAWIDEKRKGRRSWQLPGNRRPTPKESPGWSDSSSIHGVSNGTSDLGTSDFCRE
jgi:hypothetical protein